MESARSLLQQILLGGSLEDKLAGLRLTPAQLDWERDWHLRFEIPTAPGRAGAIAPRESKDGDRFPRKSDLMGRDSLRHRGRVLHYFANHELLAIETMAFTLLRFPDAPVEFKQGVFRILQEEQEHLSNYLSRMKEYGVEMGEVPLNLYFWNSLKTLESPMDFVTRMSLTFEQANLDFALEYARIFEGELDDPSTSALLQKVHDDEITHVAHGLYWFNRWRAEERGANAPAASEWDDYRKRLPFPMSARRARGSTVFFAEESRRRAGFSQDYIESVRITGGSRGRVPDLLYYNPQCEIEAQDFKWSKALRDKIADFEPILFWLGQESDLILQEHDPPKAWLQQVFEWRGELPEWIRSADAIDRPIESIKPWGWGKSAFELESRLSRHLKNKQALTVADFEQKFLSKAWWKQQLGTAGAVVGSRSELEEFLASAPKSQNSWILKAAHSTSGRGHKVIARNFSEGIEGAWVVEPYYDKVIDFSVQYELSRDGKLKSFEPRLFETDSRHQYVKSWLGVAQEGPRREFHRLLETSRAQWSAEHQRVAEILRQGGYVGPFGIDGLIARGRDGELEVVPIIEVNVRWTMGRVAQEIEKLLRRKGVTGEAEMRLLTQAQVEQTVQESRGKLIWVTPPESARNSLIAVLLSC